jgi:uncharacterized protein YndB with AHSA1/START domain
VTAGAYRPAPFDPHLTSPSMPEPIPRPDLTLRPFDASAERTVAHAPAVVYAAWTSGFDRWLAAPGAVWMTAEIGAPFVFEVRHESARHPHYGRFLRLEPARLVSLTWVTAGTGGVETVVTVVLEPDAHGTRVRLTHEGFADAAARDRHAEAWPQVLEQMEQKLRAG